MQHSPHRGSEKESAVSRACSRCKRTRRKCSNFRPCRRCLERGLAERCMASPGPVRLEAVFQRREELTEQLTDPTHVSIAMVEYCMNRFFERLFPTIPTLTPDYVDHLKDAAHGTSPAAAEARALLHAVCAVVFLQAEDPACHIHIGPVPQIPATSGLELLEQATAAHGQIIGHPKVSPSLEMYLLTLFLYACHAAVLRHSQAFFYLREVFALWQLHASHPRSDSHPHASLAGYSSLAALFRPLGTLFFALLNKEEPPVSCPAGYLENIEVLVNAAVDNTANLHATQKANLRVTQLWLRTVIWQLRLRFGYLRQESPKESLTYSYPLIVARELVLSTQDLTVESMAVHGVGLTEKLFDIASAVVDVLARVPMSANSPGALDGGQENPQSDLSYLRGLIKRLPSGKAVYGVLLEKHIETTTIGNET